jgi:hypothetical protein
LGWRRGGGEAGNKYVQNFEEEINSQAVTWVSKKGEVPNTKI